MFLSAGMVNQDSTNLSSHISKTSAAHLLTSRPPAQNYPQTLNLQHPRESTSLVTPKTNEGRSAHHKARLRHRPPAGQLMAVWAGGDDRVVGTTTTLRDGGGHGPCLSFPSFSLLVLPSSLTGAWCLGFILPCK